MSQKLEKVHYCGLRQSANTGGRPSRQVSVGWAVRQITLPRPARRAGQHWPCEPREQRHVPATGRGHTLFGVHVLWRWCLWRSPSGRAAQHQKPRLFCLCGEVFCVGRFRWQFYLPDRTSHRLDWPNERWWVHIHVTFTICPILGVILSQFGENEEACAEAYRLPRPLFYTTSY